MTRGVLICGPPPAHSAVLYLTWITWLFFTKSLTHFQCFTACVTIGTLHVVDRPLPKFHTASWSTTPDCEINFKRKIRRTDTGAVRHPSAKAFPPHYADPPEKVFLVPHIPHRKLREASPAQPPSSCIGRRSGKRVSGTEWWKLWTDRYEVGARLFAAQISLHFLLDGGEGNTHAPPPV